MRLHVASTSGDPVDIETPGSQAPASAPRSMSRAQIRKMAHAWSQGADPAIAQGAKSKLEKKKRRERAKVSARARKRNRR